MIDPNGGLNAPANWRSSLAIGGSSGRPNPSLPLSIKGIAVEAGELRFGFDGRAGSGYTINVSDSFPASSWQVFERGEPLVQDSPVEVKVDIATSAATRFFRISVP